MFGVNNNDTRAMHFFGALLLKVRIPQFASQFPQMSIYVSKFEHCKTIQFVGCLTLNFCLQIEKAAENDKK